VIAPMPTGETRSAADAASGQMPRTLVLGLGNPLLTDDAVGLCVVQHLRPGLLNLPDVELAEDYWGGLRLMERLVGYQRAIIIDAQCSGGAPGSVAVLSAEAPPIRHGGSTHDLDLSTALDFGRRAGAAVPPAGDIRIIAIEASDVDTFGQQCTPAVAAAVPRAADLVLSLLTDWR
jgi:hydrogenase maturation protease